MRDEALTSNVGNLLVTSWVTSRSKHYCAGNLGNIFFSFLLEKEEKSIVYICILYICVLYTCFIYITGVTLLSALPLLPSCNRWVFWGYVQEEPGYRGYQTTEFGEKSGFFVRNCVR